MESPCETEPLRAPAAWPSDEIRVRRFPVRLAYVTVWMLFLVGCHPASRALRPDRQGFDSLVFVPRSSAEPVSLRHGEFKEVLLTLAREVRPSTKPQDAARRLFEVQARNGSYAYEPSTHLLIPLDSTPLGQGPSTHAEMELTRGYLNWCEHSGRPGDCLRLLTDSATITEDGRFVLALALAKGAVLDEMVESFKDLADPHAMAAAVLWTWSTYMILLTVPEPLTKGVAAVMTATLIFYVGMDTFWSLIVGFRQLMAGAEGATTFSGLRTVGERYGKLMGQQSARAFALLAMAAIGNTSAGLAMNVPGLPGASQAAMQAHAQVGLQWEAVGAVTAVAVSAEGAFLSLPVGAVAMAAQGDGRSGGGNLRDNQKLADFPGELSRSQKLGVRPAAVDTREFLEYAKEGPLKWVVTPEGELRVIPHTWRGVELSHAVASGGGPVLAAGEADIAVHGRTVMGLEITPRSGHYLFGASEGELAEALRIGRQAFARFAITFP